MLFDFDSKFEFWGYQDNVDVCFSHRSGEFTISVLFNTRENFEKHTNDEKIAKKLFSEIVEYLQNTKELDSKKIENLFDEDILV